MSSLFRFNHALRLTANTRMSITDLYSSARLSIYNLNPHKKKRKIVIADRQPIFDEDGVLVKDEDSLRRAERRARVAVVDLARLNQFEYMVTFTISDEKRDLLNPYNVTKQFLQFLNDYRKQNPNFRYLLVPEFGKLHGRLHFHGLIKGLNPADIIRNEHNKLDLPIFRKAFGFVCIKRIKKSRADNERVAVYCGKYITKDGTVVKSHRYFCSQDLERPAKTIVNNPSLIKYLFQWLEKFGLLKYYDDRCICYDIPAILMEKIRKLASDFVIKCQNLKMNRQLTIEEYTYV